MADAELHAAKIVMLQRNACIYAEIRWRIEWHDIINIHTTGYRQKVCRTVPVENCSTVRAASSKRRRRCLLKAGKISAKEEVRRGVSSHIF